MATNLRTQMRVPEPSTVDASSGSQTVLQSESNNESPTVTLRLRGTQQADQRRIQWAEDVVDNEGMGKKSSKVCCIYHKPHEPDESDSDDSSSSESDDELDLSRAQRANDERKSRHKNGGKGKGKERKPSPNAYERQPRHKQGQNG